MAYLKPQTPLQHKDGDYFYPLTTVDQIVMEDGSRLNSVFKHTVKTNATLLASNWSNEAPYTQTITLDDNIDTDLNVDVNIAYSGVKETDDVLNKAASCLTYIKKNINSIVFYCLKKKPEIDIPIEIEGTCRNNIGTVNVIDGLKPNFEIVKYETEEELLADTPVENTIGIVTDTKIASWIFSATEPESPMEGMVWIQVDQRISTVDFNVLKKNGIQVYPFLAKQYIGSAWAEKTAKSYQNGEWVIWWKGELFANGNQYAHVTGGWVKGGNYTIFANDTVNSATPSIGSTISMKHTGSPAASLVSVRTSKKISLKGFSKVCTNLGYDGNAFLFVASGTSGNPVAKTSSLGSLDVSALNDDYYICIGARNGTGVTVTKVWLE